MMNMDYRRITVATFEGLLIAYITLLILEYSDPGFVSFYLNLDYLLYFMAAFGVASFLSYTQELEKSKLDRINRYVMDSFLSFLCLLVLTQIIQVAFLQEYRRYLTLATIALGVVIFGLNRDKINLEEELEDERNEEEKRKEEFVRMFPKISRIFVLRNLIKWMYKEGWWYSILLILIVLVGFGLRIYNLDFLSPVRDEYFHLVGAKRFMLEGTFNYPRTSFLTYIIGFLFKLNGGTSLFLGRLPPVIFGTLSIIAIYFLTKKINKKVGVISAYLLAFSPLAIGLSRYTREYQPHFLFILLFLIYFIYFLKRVTKFSSWWKQNKIRASLEILVVFLPIIYYNFVERVATIYELYLISAIFAIFFLIFEFIKSERKVNLLSNKKICLIIIVLSISSVLIVPSFLESYDWLLTEQFGEKEARYENLMFKPDWEYRHGALEVQWFSGSNYGKLFAISLFIFSLLFFYKNKYFMSNLFNFLAIFLIFLYAIDRYFAPRYIYYLLPFYIIVHSCSIFIILKLSKLFDNKSKLIYILLVSIILFSFFSPITAVKGLINEKDGGVDQKTEFIHRDITQLFEFLNRNNFSENDVLISANGNIFLYYYNYSFVKNASDWPLKRFDYKKRWRHLTNEFIYDYGTIYYYYYSDPVVYQHKCKDGLCEMDEMERMNKIINMYDSGWIVIDKDRNRHWNEGFPLSNYSVGDRNVVYLGETGGYRGFDIYRWMKVS